MDNVEKIRTWLINANKTFENEFFQRWFYGELYQMFDEVWKEYEERIEELQRRIEELKKEITFQPIERNLAEFENQHLIETFLQLNDEEICLVRRLVMEEHCYFIEIGADQKEIDLIQALFIKVESIYMGRGLYTRRKDN